VSDEITICGKVTERAGEIVAVAVWRVEEFEPAAERVLRITEAPESPKSRPNWAWASLAWFTACVVLGCCLVGMLR
jgi:hypothetical protein